MRSRPDQLPAAEVIRVSSIVYIDALSEVTFPCLCDPHGRSEWKPNLLELIDEPDGPPPLGGRDRGRLRVFGPVKFVIDRLRARADVRRRHDPAVGRLAGAAEIVLSERLLKE
jgi:hypothetical protein